MQLIVLWEDRVVLAFSLDNFNLNLIFLYLGSVYLFLFCFLVKNIPQNLGVDLGGSCTSKIQTKIVNLIGNLSNC